MEFMIAWRFIREVVIVGEVFCPSYKDGVSSNDGSMNIPLYSCRFRSLSRLVVFNNPPKRNNVDHIGCFVSFRFAHQNL